ncbi:MAG: hypothetical protein ACRDR6_11015 [Pseudonocardiaceae bacterium]
MLAEETGDSLLIAAAARQAVRGFIFLKYYDQAHEFARSGIDRVEPERGGGAPAYLSLYGMLFLAGAVEIRMREIIKTRAAVSAEGLSLLGLREDRAVG